MDVYRFDAGSGSGSGSGAGDVRRLWAFVLAVVFLALAWDLSGLDRTVMDRWADAQGFPWRDDPWLAGVMHDRWRRVAWGVYAALWVWMLVGVWRRSGQGVPVNERAVVLMLVSACLLLVVSLKRVSLTSCPWDLEVYGGMARHVSHWAWGQADGGPGRCFPAGHASSALAFVGLALPWLWPPSGVQRVARWGWGVLALCLLLGTVAGAVQTVRGAHYPSHTLWTLVLCLGLSLAGWAVARPRLGASRRVFHQPSPRRSGR